MRAYAYKVQYSVHIHYKTDSTSNGAKVTLFTFPVIRLGMLTVIEIISR
jgi:hypothetical protein